MFRLAHGMDCGTSCVTKTRKVFFYYSLSIKSVPRTVAGVVRESDHSLHLVPRL